MDGANRMLLQAQQKGDLRVFKFLYRLLTDDDTRENLDRLYMTHLGCI